MRLIWVVHDLYPITDLIGRWVASCFTLKLKGFAGSCAEFNNWVEECTLTTIGIDRPGLNLNHGALGSDRVLHSL